MGVTTSSVFFSSKFPGFFLSSRRSLIEWWLSHALSHTQHTGFVITNHVHSIYVNIVQCTVLQQQSPQQQQQQQSRECLVRPAFGKKKLEKKQKAFLIFLLFFPQMKKIFFFFCRCCRSKLILLRASFSDGGRRGRGEQGEQTSF